SNENAIRILNSRNEIRGDLNSGLSVLSHSFGNLSGDGDVYGNSNFDSNKLTSNQNKIEIKGDHNKVLGNVNAGSAQLTHSFASLKGGAQGSIYANNNELYSNQNSIEIDGNNNKIEGDLVAGRAAIRFLVDDISAVTALDIQASSSKMTANNNQISLNGSNTFGGGIYGGYIGFDLADASATYGKIKISTSINDVKAINNTVSISGNNTINSKDSAIYGGYLSYSTIDGKDYKPQKFDTFTGNVLNFENLKPITIGTIGNFQTYNFALNPAFANSDTALISADRIILGTNSDNSSGRSPVKSDVYVTGIHSGKVLPKGTEFLLMQGTIEGKGQGYYLEGIEQVRQGISLLYDVETKVDETNGRVTAVIQTGHDDDDDDDDDGKDPKVNPQLKSLLEGNLSGLMLITRQADNIADNTFNAISEQNRHKGLVPFIQASGHTSRYKTGSHIDANGARVTAGLSYQADQLTAAAFFEYGTADYDSYNSFANAADVHGKGDNRYYGAGLYGQYDFANGFYMDGSFRGGRLRTEYSTRDIRNAATGEAAGYTLNGNYMSAHAGTGYMFDLNEANQLNTSLKYLWSKTSSHDLTIAGDPIHFDSLTSSRLRLNAENQYKYNQSWSFLAGMGLEYEFDGKATGTTYGRFDIDPASVRGFTTIGTLGVRFQPTANDRFSVDLKGNAYLGKREGGNLSVKVQYAF
ncbi:MAG: autotransporter outer membrane beta-barrel domain-containing protein, partial [Brucellaceae bacterium]|nr:autotransporter outer membrane beta-barrel domain-containing protein [Brucellaceae bacterium]